MNYFNVSNVFESRRKNTDLSCERAWQAIEDNAYLTEIIDTLSKYQDRRVQRMSSK